MCLSQSDDPDCGNVRKHVNGTMFWRDRAFTCPGDVSFSICLCLLSFCVRGKKKNIWTSYFD